MPRLPGPPPTTFAPPTKLAQPKRVGPPRPAFVPPPAARQGGVAQRHGASDAFAIDPGRLGLAGGGRPLPEGVRGKMEAALGADFSNVRVHIGPQAERIGAIAFTIGSDIYFAPGRYQPETPHGQQLLGHELAHVVQQRAGRVRNPLGSGLVVVQDTGLEAEADRLGRHAAAHRFAAQPKMGPGMAQPSAPVRISPPISTGPGSYRLTAAVSGGRPAGSVMVHARDKGVVEVTDLHVAEAQRGHGIGQRLLASAARTGQQFGRSKVTLGSQDNGSGHLTRWYKGMGFAQVGVNHRGFPQLEAPINRLVAASAQRKRLPSGSSTLQTMEEIPAEGRRKHWRREYENVAVLKLELAGSENDRWYYFKGGKQQELKPLLDELQKLKAKEKQIIEWRRRDSEKRQNYYDDTYSIKGPSGKILGIDASKGARDSGPNKIAYNIVAAENIIGNFIFLNMDNAHRILILIKAHSRNAVAGVLVVNYIHEN
jgi:ribosomal protein S18 acetylase RimI-like enzyme